MATALAAMLFDPDMKGFKNELTVMGNDREKDVIKRVDHGFRSFGRGFVGIERLFLAAPGIFGLYTLW